MSYRGIIISGPKYAGKSTITKQLCERTSYFKQIKSVTTRIPRPDDADDYEYISDTDFNRLISSGKLLLHTTYGENQYGIKSSELTNRSLNSKIPIFVITPETIPNLESTIKSKFAKEEQQDLLTFFIDATDENLQLRSNIRNECNLTVNEQSQINKDREYKDYAIHVLNNNNIDDTVNLILELWRYRESGGVIPKKILEYGIKSDLFLKNADFRNVTGAAYDLHLGEEYYYAGKIRRTEKNDLFIIIDPYDYAIVTSKENTNLPRNIVARFDLSVRLFCQGIILSNGPQIDPGFRGNLFCLLFNTSNKQVVLKKGEKYATIEFTKLLTHTEAYSGKYQDKNNIIDYLPSNVMQGAISELKKELDEIKNDSKTLQSYFLGVIAIILATIPLLLLFKS